MVHRHGLCICVYCHSTERGHWFVGGSVCFCYSISVNWNRGYLPSSRGAVVLCTFCLCCQRQHVPLVWKVSNWYQSWNSLFCIVCPCFYVSWGHSFAHRDGYANFSCFLDLLQHLSLKLNFVFFEFQKESFLVGEPVVVVKSCLGGFSSLLQGTTAVGRCLLTEIFLLLLPWVRSLQISS